MLKAALVAAASAVASANIFSYQTAMQGVYYSGVAYCDQSSVLNWNCGTPCSNLPTPQHVTRFANSGLDIAGIVASYGTHTVVAFRGTSDIKNWIADLDFIKTSYYLCDSCEVHLGFLTSFQEVQSMMYDALNSYGSINGPVFVTGHSLGGAIATLAALDLLDQGYTITDLYTYGGPRVGDAYFAEFASQFINSSNTNFNRAVHYQDVVPHLPPEAAGFTHAPREIWFSEDSSYYTVCNSVNGEDGNCSDQFYFPDSVDDHLSYMGYPISGSCVGSTDSSAKAPALRGAAQL